VQRREGHVNIWRIFCGRQRQAFDWGWEGRGGRKSGGRHELVIVAVGVQSQQVFCFDVWDAFGGSGGGRVIGFIRSGHQCEFRPSTEHVPQYLDMTSDLFLGANDPIVCQEIHLCWEISIRSHRVQGDAYEELIPPSAPSAGVSCPRRVPVLMQSWRRRLLLATRVGV